MLSLYVTLYIKIVICKVSANHFIYGDQTSNYFHNKTYKIYELTESYCVVFLFLVDEMKKYF